MRACDVSLQPGQSLIPWPNPLSRNWRVESEPLTGRTAFVRARRRLTRPVLYRIIQSRYAGKSGVVPAMPIRLQHNHI